MVMFSTLFPSRFPSSPKNRRVRRSTVSVTALILGSAVLTACGGVTVEGNSGSTETTTSLARETATEETTAATESSRSSSGGGNAPAPRDQPAAEMTEAPSTAAQRSPQELDLLDGLREGGIDVDGVEDPLIATANAVCRSLEGSGDGGDNTDNTGSGDNVTLDAIAGQLITQGRVDIPEERAAEVSTLIRETAERTYC